MVIPFFCGNMSKSSFPRLKEHHSARPPHRFTHDREQLDEMEERKHVVDARVSEPGAMLSPQHEMSRRHKRWHGVRLSADPTTGNRLKEVVSIGKSVRECEDDYCARRLIVGKLHVLLQFHVVERWLGSERWTRNASQGNEIDSKNRRANCHVSLQSRKGEKEGRAEWDN